MKRIAILVVVCAIGAAMSNGGARAGDRHRGHQHHQHGVPPGALLPFLIAPLVVAPFLLQPPVYQPVCVPLVDAWNRQLYDQFGRPLCQWR
jgi:hypothetical protein